MFPVCRHEHTIPKTLNVFSDFAFRYIFLLKFLQTYGRLYHLVPAFPWLKDLLNNRASLLHRHYPVSALLQAHPPPSCHNPTSQRLLVIGLVFSSNFLLGQVGLLQSLDMSLLPCCRYHPAGIGQTRASLVCLYCLRPQIAGSASRVIRLRGHLCVHFRYGLVTCSSPLR